MERFLVSAKQALANWDITQPLTNPPFYMFMHFLFNLFISLHKKVLSRGVLLCLFLIITFKYCWNKYPARACSWVKIRLEIELLTAHFQTCYYRQITFQSTHDLPTPHAFPSFDLLVKSSSLLCQLRYLTSLPHFITSFPCLALSEFLLLQGSNITVQRYLIHFKCGSFNVLISY